MLQGVAGASLAPLSEIMDPTDDTINPLNSSSWSKKHRITMDKSVPNVLKSYFSCLERFCERFRGVHEPPSTVIRDSGTKPTSGYPKSSRIHDIEFLIQKKSDHNGQKCSKCSKKLF